MFGKVKKVSNRPPVNYSQMNEGFLGMSIPKHKDGRAYSDVDMLELMGQTIMDEERKQSEINPTLAYIPKYDPNLVTLAKEVAQARAEGVDESTIRQHVQNVMAIK